MFHMSSGLKSFKVVKRSSLLVPSFDCLHIPGTLLKTSSFEMTASEFGFVKSHNYCGNQ